MSTIKCPVCGEVNPANAEFCQNCMSRLEPLTGPLKGEDAPIQPGQLPTKKVTAELEPILPQWLRDAREKARQSASEDAADSSLSSQNAAPPAPAAPDLLAGLASQGGEEEADVPDWLVSLTGSVPSKKKKNEPDESQQVKWVELGGHEDSEDVAPSIAATQTPSEIPVENTPPSWMAPQEPVPEKDELADWLSRAGRSSASPPGGGGESVQSPEPAAPTPFFASSPEDADWLKNLESQPFGSASGGESPSASGLSEDRNPQRGPAPASPPAGDLPDWLSKLPAQQAAPDSPPPSSGAEPRVPSQVDRFQGGPPAQSEPAAPAEIPDWLKAFGQAPVTPATPESSSAEVPDWLKAASAQSGGGLPQKGSPPAPSPAQDSGQTPVVSETPDWLAGLKPAEPQSPTPPPETIASAFTSQEVSQASASTPAFTEAPPATGDNADAIFGSLQVPDWLTVAGPKSTDQSSSDSNVPPQPAETGETIAPAELPSWVKAMRPVESALPASPAPGTESSMEEAGGPLAGLQDVLPAGPSFLPTSKPKAYSIKLNATNEHQTQAKLLEQILAAETAPIPMRATPAMMSQRVLRWALGVLMFLMVGGVLLAGTQIFALPARVPDDQTEMAISAMEKIPAGAPVLAVFDYEPSLSGEMQTVAAPYLSRLLLLKHPRLTILSSSPTGPALAEQLMTSLQSGSLPVQGYQPGRQYVDLGYLPGGLAGVYEFAQDPAMAMPLAADGSQAWQTAPLQGVTHFSDFASIILLTDSPESGRVWIEQAGPLRGNASLVIVSSSQAGPMFMPYVASGQVNGLINGLNDASKVEQANGQAGLARRYWDAYSLGSLLAAVMIILGGLWSLVSGLQARRAEREKS